MSESVPDMAPEIAKPGESKSSSEVKITIKPDQYTRLEEVQKFLVDGADVALKQPSFALRNEEMAKDVGIVDGLGAAKSTRAIENLPQLESVFIKAAEEAGQKFAPAFDEAGKPIKENEGQYKQAMNAAGEVALNHLPDAVKAVGVQVYSESADKMIDVSADQIKDSLRRADFKDVLEYTSYEIIRNFPRDTVDAARQTLDYSQNTIKEILHETAKGDYFEDRIDSIPINETREAQTESDQQILDTAIRLANATWKVGQVHRAAWEGNTSRIDPNKRGGVFNPFDLLKRQQFEGYKAQGLSDEKAMIRTAFEVYKDIDQYKPLVNQPTTPFA